MGYIDLHDYYLASILTQLKDWLADTPSTLWGNIENTLTPGRNLKDCLFASIAKHTHYNHHSPTIRASIKAWKSLCSFSWPHLPTKIVHIPLTTLSHLSPELQVPAWLASQAPHVSALRSLTDNKSFSQIREELNAPASDFLTYLRLKSCLSAHPHLEMTLPIKIWLFLFSDDTRFKGTSLIYSSLQDKSVFLKSKPLTDWELDLQEQFTDIQWQNAINATYKATTCTSLWEVAYKTTMRWYLTPLKLAKYHTSTSPLCWRGCNHMGSLIHIMWSCPLIRQLWTQVELLLQKVLLIPILLTPQLSLLNLTIETLPPKLRLITSHILLSTKLLIARKWKSQEIPTISEVTSLTHTHCLYELTLSRSKPSFPKLQLLWLPWIQWYNKPPP